MVDQRRDNKRELSLDKMEVLLGGGFSDWEGDIQSVLVRSHSHKGPGFHLHYGILTMRETIGSIESIYSDRQQFSRGVSRHFCNMRWLTLGTIKSHQNAGDPFLE